MFMLMAAYFFADISANVRNVKHVYVAISTFGSKE